jgi:3',5'-cyclic AMP phosphodiesterase CpdA
VPNKNWYSFDLGSWHVVVIASYCSRNGNCEEQKAWLSADLAAHPNQCTLAMWHQPRYSSGAVHGNYSGIDWAWDMLYRAGAELVLTGHEHTYERFAPIGASDERDNAFGLREFVVGTGGRSHYDFNSPLSTTEVRDNTTYGVLLLTLKSGSYDWKFVPVNSGGFTDAGSGSCHGKPSSAGATSSTLSTVGPVAVEGWVFAIVLAVRRFRNGRRGATR